jgi:flagellar biogenesis protein FliO
VQQAIAVFVVLGLLGATLYWLRRQGAARLTMPRLGGSPSRQLQSIERLSLTAQHSLHLVCVAGRTLLIAVSPSGCTVLDQSPSASLKRNDL